MKYFCDAKQYWELDDFINIKESPICNAANLAFFMLNVAHILRLKVISVNAKSLMEKQ